MQELANQGEINPGTRQKTVYPLFKGNGAYANIIGDPGYNRLKLSLDVVDGMGQKSGGKMEIASSDTTRNTNSVTIRS